MTKVEIRELFKIINLHEPEANEENTNEINKKQNKQNNKKPNNVYYCEVCGDFASVFSSEINTCNGMLAFMNIMSHNVITHNL